MRISGGRSFAASCLALAACANGVEQPGSYDAGTSSDAANIDSGAHSAPTDAAASILDAATADARPADAAPADARPADAAPADARSDATVDARPDPIIDAGSDATVDATVDASLPPGDAAGVTITFTGRTDTPLRGANSGARFDDACPTGEALIGFSGSLANVNGSHGRIAANCGVVDVVGDGLGGLAVRVTPGTVLPVRGTHDRSPWSRVCPANNVMVGFTGRGGLYIDQLTFRCAPLTIASANGAFTVGVGAGVNLAAIGGTGGNAFAQADCPAGEVATVGIIRGGDFIDALGLGCSVPTAQ